MVSEAKNRSTLRKDWAHWRWSNLRRSANAKTADLCWTEECTIW